MSEFINTLSAHPGTSFLLGLFIIAVLGMVCETIGYVVKTRTRG